MTRNAGADIIHTLFPHFCQGLLIAEKLTAQADPVQLTGRNHFRRSIDLHPSRAEHRFAGKLFDIDQIMIRRRKIERFIDSVKGLPELITEFDESLWAALVDSMTVYAKDWIVFRLTCGMEIEA